MKEQIIRLSPHQNGKVFSVVMALSSLIMVIPFTAVLCMAPKPANMQGNLGPQWFIPLVFPIIYLISGYIMTVVGCAIYNSTFKYLGGIEYELKNENVCAGETTDSGLNRGEPSL